MYNTESYQVQYRQLSSTIQKGTMDSSDCSRFIFISTDKDEKRF